MILDGFDNTEVKEDKTLDTKIDQSKSCIIDIDEDWITFGNIKCYGAEGILESYRRVQLARSTVRDHVTSRYFSLKSAIVHLESHDQFLPSMALTCNLVMQLYEHRDDFDCVQLLNQYKRIANQGSMHIQNTLIDWNPSYGSKHIRHYPPEHYFGPNRSISLNAAHQTRAWPFKDESIEHSSLHEALAVPSYQSFLQNLTGLQDPDKLIEVGDFFSKLTYVYVPSRWARKRTVVQLGSSGNLQLNAEAAMYAISFARAARIPQ